MEASVTPKVLAWFRTQKHICSCAIEIKATTGNKIRENALQPHQKQALLAAKHGVIVHKIADNRTRLPFDAFMLTKAESYVVACFTAHRVCLVFDIDNWQGASHDDEALFRIKL